MGDADTVVFDDAIDVAGDTATSLVALGQLDDDSFEVRALEDDVSPVGGDESRIKAVHASPDAPAVDIVPEGADEPLDLTAAVDTDAA